MGSEMCIRDRLFARNYFLHCFLDVPFCALLAPSRLPWQCPSRVLATREGRVSTTMGCPPGYCAPPVPWPQNHAETIVDSCAAGTLLERPRVVLELTAEMIFRRGSVASAFKTAWLQYNHRFTVNFGNRSRVSNASHENKSMHCYIHKSTNEQKELPYQLNSQINI